MAKSTGCVFVPPGKGNGIILGLNRLTTKLNAEATSGGCGLVELDVGPHFEAPPTPHAHTREAFVGYVLQGQIALVVDEQTYTVPTGGTIYVPQNAYFRWWNPDDTPAKWLCFYVPGGFESFFSEVGMAMADMPPGPPQPEEMESRIRPLWREYGITPQLEA